jgi:hypothetical protein
VFVCRGDRLVALLENAATPTVNVKQ